MNERENLLRSIEFRHPEWIPCHVEFSPLAIKQLGAEIERLARAHPRLFSDFDAGGGHAVLHEMPPGYRAGEYLRDNWGCLWQTLQDGVEGQVIEHPLADWGALQTYRPPDPLRQAEREERDWDEIARNVQARKSQGRLTASGWGARLFDRLYFLRGFENLMLDFAAGDPRLPALIGMVENYEAETARQWIKLGVDLVFFHSDIGTQHGLMISPEHFRRYIKPMFQRLFQACRRGGAHVYFSSDGNLLEITDDLIECGVSVHDPQLRAGTLADIARHYRGRLCARVNLDEQSFPFATPDELRRQVREVVEVMADPAGGLMLWAVFGADVPLRNIAAVCEALEDYCF